MSDAKDAVIRCVVGVDFRPGSGGAIEWTSWATARATGPLDVLAVHAAHTDDGGYRDCRPQPEIRDQALALMRGHGARFDLVVDEERTPAEALDHVAADFDADVVVIGRRSTRHSNAMVRLGSVARRVLRAMPCPVLVCPADLNRNGVPSGPILVAVHSRRDSEQAVVMASRVARLLGRPLAFVTAFESDPSTGLGVGEAADPIKHEAKFLQSWLREHSVDQEAIVVPHPPTPGILAVAERLKACLIVCGARPLSRSNGILSSSVGNKLAGAATVPTLVVPPRLEP